MVVRVKPLLPDCFPLGLDLVRIIGGLVLDLLLGRTAEKIGYGRLEEAHEVTTSRLLLGRLAQAPLLVDLEHRVDRLAQMPLRLHVYVIGKATLLINAVVRALRLLEASHQLAELVLRHAHGWYVAVEAVR